MSIFDSLMKPNIRKLEEKKDVSGLIKIVTSDKDNDSRREAVKALGRLNDPMAILPLTQMVSDRQIGDDAVRTIAEIKSPESIQALLLFLSHKEFEVRAKALDQIKKMGDKSAISSLVKMLAHDDKIVIRKKAADILDKFGWIPSKDKDGAYYWATKENFQKTAELGEEAIDIILNFVKIDENNASARSAIEYIKDPKAVDKLISLLDYEGCFFRYNSHEVQENVIIALKNIGDPKAIDPLIAKSQRDKSYGVSKKVMEALSIMGNSRVVNYLIDCLKIKEKGDSRFGFAAMALGKIGNPSAVDPLIDLLLEKDLNWMDCVEVVKALGTIGDPRAVDPMIVLYNNRSPFGTLEIQQAIVEAFGNIGDERPMELLLKVSTGNKGAKWDEYKIEGSDSEYDGYLKIQGLGGAARAAIAKIQKKQSKFSNV